MNLKIDEKQGQASVVSRLLLAGSFVLISACTTVGPDYVQPESPLSPDWYEAEIAGYTSTSEQQALWWEKLNDAHLNALITRAHEANNSLEIAGLRVLEARAVIGIATGQQYPQSQVLAGGASAVGASDNAANTTAGDLNFTQFDIGVGANWEFDFWGKFRRGIQAADASYMASVAAYDQVMILVTAQVAFSYLAYRTFEEQLRITLANIAAQQRSFDIVNVLFTNGNTSELDVLQARTLLLSTQATVPAIESELKKTKHAISALLGLPPGSFDTLLSGEKSIPRIPVELEIGLPADLLRQRPDVRQAEYLAMAQNANVGLAVANLYPSFSISGSLGLVAAGNTNTTRTGQSGPGQLFSTDSLTYSLGTGFVWPFFNYGRIKNNIRVQDARLQQALIAYRETVIQAAREVEDAAVALDGARRQSMILEETVSVARRSADVAMLRFNEGFADYQRVLDAQQILFSQEGRYVSSKSEIVSGFISLYLALGGGWHARHTGDLIQESTAKTMKERTDWSDLIEATETDTSIVIQDKPPL
ncbi:MAG: NodT family efflux transporter outer membrane factor (OMF) lipoprotein [Lysobacterales bacterium]|jgi:NodT family efflux transporter outer membrane factor (OMF) lipoprotein